MSKNLLEEIYRFYPEYLEIESSYYSASKEYQRKLDLLLKAKPQNILIEKMLRNQIDKFPIINWTDLESNTCHEFRILLNQVQDIMDDDILLINSLGGMRRDLYLFISALSKYYHIEIIETKYNKVDNNWFFSKLSKSNFKEIVGKTDSVMRKLNYKEINEQNCKQIVPNIEMDLKSFGEVSVFNALFTDLQDI